MPNLSFFKSLFVSCVKKLVISEHSKGGKYSVVVQIVSDFRLLLRCYVMGCELLWCEAGEKIEDNKGTEGTCYWFARLSCAAIFRKIGILDKILIRSIEFSVWPSERRHEKVSDECTGSREMLSSGCFDSEHKTAQRLSYFSGCRKAHVGHQLFTLCCESGTVLPSRVWIFLLLLHSWKKCVESLSLMFSPVLA